MPDAQSDRYSLKLGTTSSLNLPRLGLGSASHGEALTGKETSLLKALNLSHLRVDLNLSQPDYIATLRQASAEAEVLGVALEAALILTDETGKELISFREQLELIKPNIATWLIFNTDEKVTSDKWIHLARPILAGYEAGARIGGGTNIYFTELNRQRPQIESLDVVNFSINPQVHAFDDASLVETLEALPSVIESARQFVGQLPISVSPVTLKPRFNPDAKTPEAVQPGIAAAGG
ncbi:MAG: hypothetical protein WKF84_05905 [Pyrinomonadaceae bacterium]